MITVRKRLGIIGVEVFIDSDFEDFNNLQEICLRQIKAIVFSTFSKAHSDIKKALKKSEM